MKNNLLPNKQKAFTLIELIIGIAIVGILTTIAMPSLSRFSVGLKVDGEISELHRLILLTRNAAINTGNNVVICPLDEGTCVSQWDKEISVFEDVNNDGIFNDEDIILKVKAEISSNDKLQFSGNNSLVYTPRGNLLGGNGDSTFSYCPSGYNDEAKAIILSALGRPYISRDGNDDGYDEDRQNNNITCT